MYDSPYTDDRSSQFRTGNRSQQRTSALGGQGLTDGAEMAGSEAQTYETGTTIVALSADNGVVMAADKRMSLGGRFTASKDVQKITQVHPTAAMAISGGVGPAQQLLESLRAEASLYRTRRGEPMSMTALSQTAGHLVRGLPVQPLLAGVDEGGGHVYELDGSGSVIEDTYSAGGSGMQTAYGLLEGRVEDGLSIADAEGIAFDAVIAASERDTASGNGVTVATITEEDVVFRGNDNHSTAEGGDR